ncbi:unnamed protein product [Ilex paraguariensis]|uniref:Uncharacterized protein n=1 Tax=Ilex paraguariensis TaxID=185542 RepID=A0ABC8SRB4_9AQUA
MSSGGSRSGGRTSNGGGRDVSKVKVKVDVKIVRPPCPARPKIVVPRRQGAVNVTKVVNVTNVVNNTVVVAPKPKPKPKPNPTRVVEPKPKPTRVVDPRTTRPTAAPSSSHGGGNISWEAYFRSGVAINWNNQEVRNQANRLGMNIRGGSSSRGGGGGGGGGQWCFNAFGQRVWMS